MAVPLRVLVIEDSPDDAALVERTLRHGGYDPVVRRVDTPGDLRAAMDNAEWDVVICDYAMPQFDAPAALQIVRERGIDLPFIIVSGTIGEETAVAAMKAGAHDYLMKGNLVRLIAAVERELREVQVRRERRRAEQAETEQRALAEALRDTAEAMSASLDLDEVLDRVLDNVGRVVPHDVATIMLLERGVVRVVRARGYAERGLEASVLGLALPIVEMPLLRRMTESGIPVIIADARETSDWVDLGIDLPVRSYVGVPLRAKGETVGFLNLNSQTAGFFSAQHAQRLQAFADQAAVAIANARVYAGSARQVQQLAALRTIDTAITSSLDLRVTLDVILDQVTAQLQADAASVLLLNHRLQSLDYAAGRGFRAQGVVQTRLRLGEGLAGRCAIERRTIYRPDLREAADEVARRDLLLKEGFVTYHATPLVAKARVVGILEVFHRSPFSAEPDWLGFLEALAGQAAIAIDNASLFTDLQRANIDLTLAYDTTLEGWSRALDLRDRETEGHTQRVTDLTQRLARAAGMSEEDLVHVRRGALLHDIGKMGIPDSILLKPAPLTDDEWIVMRKHPVYAYELLSPIAYLRPALDIPYSHHEKWNGTGYPRGLRGDQIPLAARIFAVVDVWDALRSDRPYRPAWQPAKALEYIEQEAGAHFDPAAAQVFLKFIAAEGSGTRAK